MLKKGLTNKEVHAFLKVPDLTESHCPWSVPLGLLHLSSLEEFLLGTFASHGRSELLLACSSPPDIDGLASTAIWANCQVGNDSGDVPTSSNFSASSTLLSSSLWVGAYSTSGTEGSAGTGGAGSVCISTLVQTWRALLPSPICSVFLVLAMLEFHRESATAVSWESHDVCCEC